MVPRCPVSPMVGIFVSSPGRCPAHLSVIIPIEVTHKNVAPVAANFAPPAAAAAHILAAAFLGLELHLDPGRGLARRGELAKPATRTHSEVWKGSLSTRIIKVDTSIGYMYHIYVH